MDEMEQFILESFKDDKINSGLSLFSPLYIVYKNAMKNLQIMPFSFLSSLSKKRTDFVIYTVDLIEPFFRYK